MEILNYYKKAMCEYVTFSGRATRAEFWSFFLVMFLMSLTASLLDPSGTISGLITIIHFLPNLAVASRRLHDTGLSGWWQLLIIVPLFGLIAVIVLWCREGETGPNKYGTDPRTSDAVA